MTEKELKKLRRADLLELLLEKTKENEQLLAETADLKRQLASRTIAIDKAGSIAEAALQLNGIFDAAQDAAAQYLENIRSMSEGQEQLCSRIKAETEEKCRQMEAETIEKCKTLESDTEERCSQMEDKARIRCREMIEKANEEASARWADASGKLEEFYQTYEGLREMLSPKGDAK